MVKSWGPMTLFCHLQGHWTFKLKTDRHTEDIRICWAKNSIFLWQKKYFSNFRIWTWNELELGAYGRIRYESCCFLGKMRGNSEMSSFRRGARPNRPVLGPTSIVCGEVETLGPLLYAKKLSLGCTAGYIYRVSQKKRPHVLNGHNSHKNGTRNKSKVSFGICM